MILCPSLPLCRTLKYPVIFITTNWSSCRFGKGIYEIKAGSHITVPITNDYCLVLLSMLRCPQCQHDHENPSMTMRISGVSLAFMTNIHFDRHIYNEHLYIRRILHLTYHCSTCALTQCYLCSCCWPLLHLWLPQMGMIVINVPLLYQHLTIPMLNLTLELQRLANGCLPVTKCTIGCVRSLPLELHTVNGCLLEKL